MFYDKAETLNVEGVVYNEETHEWGGVISATAILALKNAVSGPAPNLPALQRALSREIEQLIQREIEYTAWKRGAVQNDKMSHCEPEAARGSHEKGSK